METFLAAKCLKTSFSKNKNSQCKFLYFLFMNFDVTDDNKPFVIVQRETKFVYRLNLIFVSFVNYNADGS